MHGFCKEFVDGKNVLRVSDMINTARVDKIIQYALAVASEQDFGDRELGPIHFVKYVYVADLEYAKSHDGVTYTGANWTFYHFGPWCPAVHDRIDPALKAIGADKKVISSIKCDDDFVRWHMPDKDIADEMEKELDFLVSINVKNAVRKFAADTYSLLHYVYKTQPMLDAAPNESLVFLPVNLPKKAKSAEEKKEPTARQLKKQKQKTDRMRSFVQKQLDKKKKQVASKQPAPRYDEVFAAGQAMLDDLAGSPITTETLVCEIADDVWKSKSRHDPDLPS